MHAYRWRVSTVFHFYLVVYRVLSIFHCFAVSVCALDFWNCGNVNNRYIYVRGCRFSSCVLMVDLLLNRALKPIATEFLYRAGQTGNTSLDSTRVFINLARDVLRKGMNEDLASGIECARCRRSLAWLSSRYRLTNFSTERTNDVIAESNIISLAPVISFDKEITSERLKTHQWCCHFIHTTSSFVRILCAFHDTRQHFQQVFYT